MNEFYKNQIFKFVDEIKKAHIERFIEPYAAPEMMDEKLCMVFDVLMCNAIDNAKENFKTDNYSEFVIGTSDYHNLQMILTFNHDNIKTNNFIPEEIKVSVDKSLINFKNK